MRTLKITGKGQLRQRPDMTCITLTLEGTYPEYGEAIRGSSQDTELLRELLAGFGFDRRDLKTVSFGVDTEYESYQEDGAYRQRFVGYRFRHTLKVEMPADNARLGEVLYALANGVVKPELRLSFTVSDPEAAKNALLEKAVADAREKAAVLTKAAGVHLGDIQSIDYSWGELEFEVRPVNQLPMAAKASYDMNIEPEDIEVTDTVTVLWEIQ